MVLNVGKLQGIPSMLLRRISTLVRNLATFRQIFPQDASNKVWSTHSSPFGWSVRGLTRFECMDKQNFTRLTRGPVGSGSKHLLGLGDKTGRVLLTRSVSLFECQSQVFHGRIVRQSNW